MEANKTVTGHVCPLCGRVPGTVHIDRHHPIPKTFRGKDQFPIHTMCHRKKAAHVGIAAPEWGDGGVYRVGGEERPWVLQQYRQFESKEARLARGHMLSSHFA